MANWKSFIFADEGSEEKKVEKPVAPKETATMFPTQESEPEQTITKFPSAEQVEAPLPRYVSTVTSGDNPFLSTMRETLANKFKELNKEGVDFFEFYNSIVEDGNINELSLYPMAFKMLVSLNKGGTPLTKDTILDDGVFYVENLERVFEETNIQARERETTLNSEILDLENQLNAIKRAMEEKQNKLGEIDLKISASRTAKDELVTSIRVVMTNIDKTIK